MLKKTFLWIISLLGVGVVFFLTLMKGAIYFALIGLPVMIIVAIILEGFDDEDKEIF